MSFFFFSISSSRCRVTPLSLRLADGTLSRFLIPSLWYRATPRSLPLASSTRPLCAGGCAAALQWSRRPILPPSRRRTAAAVAPLVAGRVDARCRHPPRNRRETAVQPSCNRQVAATLDAAIRAAPPAHVVAAPLSADADGDGDDERARRSKKRASIVDAATLMAAQVRRDFTTVVLQNEKPEGTGRDGANGRLVASCVCIPFHSIL